MQETKEAFSVKLKRKKSLKIIIGLGVLLVVLLLFSFMRGGEKLISHKQANALYVEDKITRVILEGEFLYLITPNQRYKIYQGAINKKAFFEKYPVEVVEESGDAWYNFFSLVIILAAFALLYRTIEQSKRPKKGAVKEEVKPTQEQAGIESMEVEPLHSKITFENVAGIHDVKEELEEIIDFLKEPWKYQELDIRLPRGVLLVGPPGVGKTLVSKAVAGEANVPFFYQSGASFVHIYVGMGAKRVSELFQKAKQMAPSIIFIDEIDAVGKSRGEFRNDEREATLNQLLTEMDGFEDSSGVIVIGATNKIEMLDEALLRAGRFDRRIHISLPDLSDRIKILDYYLSTKPHMVNIEEVAQMTVGFNAAALDTLTNEAALHAMRAKGPMIETRDFVAVKDKVLLGKRKILSFSEQEREVQALYQGAKAVVAVWLDVEFERISIINTALRIQEKEIFSKSQLLARVKVYLAGSLAMQKRYKESFSNGASDIATAKEILAKVVYEYAMTDSFVVTSKQEEVLLREAVSEVSKLLDSLDNALDAVVKHMLRYESITANECRDILREIF
jgi:cell division protease FtsH